MGQARLDGETALRKSNETELVNSLYRNVTETGEGDVLTAWIPASTSRNTPDDAVPRGQESRHHAGFPIPGFSCQTSRLCKISWTAQRRELDERVHRRYGLRLTSDECGSTYFGLQKTLRVSRPVRMPVFTCKWRNPDRGHGDRFRPVVSATAWATAVYHTNYARVPQRSSSASSDF